MANSVDPEQTALKGAVCSGSTLFASILNLSVMLANYLQQTTSAADISEAFFLGALRVKLTISIVTIIMEKLYNLYERFGNVRCCENSTYHMNKCFTNLTLKTKK